MAGIDDPEAKASEPIDQESNNGQSHAGAGALDIPRAASAVVVPAESRRSSGAVPDAWSLTSPWPSPSATWPLVVTPPGGEGYKEASRRRSKSKLLEKSLEKLKEVQEAGTNTMSHKAVAFLRAAQTEGKLKLDPQPLSYVQQLMWIFFGSSGWWSSNAIFAELPLLVVALPAAERLGNQLSMMIQIGNVFLIAYKVTENYVKINFRMVIHGMMAMAILSQLLCIFMWDAQIGGASIPLLLFMIIAGGVGCLSNATYWAYMISFPKQCTKWAAVGMSAGGVMTTLLAMLQMAGRSASNPRFNATIFFMLAAGVQACWWLVICFQQGLISCRRRHDDPDQGGRDEAGSPLVPRTTSKTFIKQAPDAKAVCRIRALYCCSFVLHGATYTLPTLMPFVAAAYPKKDEEQSLLLWMLFLQQGGETCGRIMAPSGSSRRAEEELKVRCCRVRREYMLPAVSALSLLFVFVSFTTVAAFPPLLPAVLPADAANLVLPGLSFCFYFSYGVVQTAVFLWARRLTKDHFYAEEVASRMGFFGQLGALSANLVAFVIVNYGTWRHSHGK